jgi:deoxyribodipyrimidine photo-lyase
MKRTAFWFKNDLRLADNPGLLRAIELSENGAFFPFYIYDDEESHPVQGASAWWLSQSLDCLGESLAKLGHTLHILKGSSLATLQDFCDKNNVETLHFSRRYDPEGIKLQQEIQNWCSSHNIECARFAASLLSEPDRIFNKQAKAFKVFTPYYKHCLTLDLRTPVKAPRKIRSKAPVIFDAIQVEELNLRPSKPNWASEFSNFWQPGEQGASQLLAQAITDKIDSYADDRDFPAKDGCSRIAAHLRFGEISPATIWHTVSASLAPEQSQPWLRQIIWREFSYYLLFHFPHIIEQPFVDKFKAFNWRKNPTALKAWQQGKTGYPLVDAAMRELWQSGSMHNRCRMVVASFLTKHLGIHWRDGAAWFWDTLVDADIANNTAGWQWVAGCGADAAPYFRIFNPTTQAEKFDPSGDYIRRWLPELIKLPKQYIHSPWLAPKEVLDSSEIELGVDYPTPIVDHKQAREHALELYRNLPSVG